MVLEKITKYIFYYELADPANFVPPNRQGI